jgi:hypothetical protein
MTKTIKLITLLMLLLVVKANAQIEIQDTKKLDRIKEGQTYVLVNTTTFPGADKFLQAMRQDWTLTKGIYYLPANNATITIAPNDSFLSLESLTETSGSSSRTYFFLNFWTCKERYFKKDREMKQSDHEVIAQVTLSLGDKVADSDFDSGGMFLNWSPGMVHNYLQQISTLLNNKKKKKFQDGIENKTELVALKSEILYVPEFDLLNSKMFSVKHEARDEESVNAIFEKYTYAYKVLSTDDLDKLILTSEKPIYYLLLIKHSTNKLVCVINSKTGETIYSDAANLSMRLKAGDIKSLFKAVNKS